MIWGVDNTVNANELQRNYPETWEGIQRHRDYMQHVLGISLKSEVLPLSDIYGYLRSSLLNRE